MFAYGFHDGKICEKNFFPTSASKILMRCFQATSIVAQWQHNEKDGFKMKLNIYFGNIGILNSKKHISSHFGFWATRGSNVKRRKVGLKMTTIVQNVNKCTTVFKQKQHLYLRNQLLIKRNFRFNNMNLSVFMHI